MAAEAASARGCRSDSRPSNWRPPPGGCYHGSMGVRYVDRARRAERLRRELREIVARIVDDDTEQVLLFGSAARGQVASMSDLDVLVVRRDDRPPAARADDLYRRAQPRVAPDMLVYTPEELQAARASSSFLRTALREAPVVYERSRPVA